MIINLRCRIIGPILILLLLTVLFHLPSTIAWSIKQDTDTASHDSRHLTRTDFLSVGIGGIAALGYGKLVGDTFTRISRGIAYPAAHELRVRSIIEKTLSEISSVTHRPLQVLEVGIGTDCRLIRRGLYDEALKSMATKGVTDVHLMGMDIHLPSEPTVEQAKIYLKQATKGILMNIDLQLVEGDLTSTSASRNIPLAPGSVDAIICCLTLCSVNDLEAAIHFIKSLLRPNGGTLGFVEHVAVQDNEPFRSLDWQQRSLDPLQQLVAHNCHLHRYTETTIGTIFGVETHQSVQLLNERFLVNDMWPVSCQCCGVIRRNS
jgi:SAM-dependent methyltransferase